MGVQQYFRRKKAQQVGNAFISTWNTANTSSGSSASNQVRLPLLGTGIYNFLVDWGDGNSDTITAWNQSEVTHTYASSGDYIITITGLIVGWGFQGVGDRQKIIEISQWGNLLFRNSTNSMGNSGFFRGCVNLSITAFDSPDFTGVNQINGMFKECGNSFTIISNIENWDVSNISDFRHVFFQTAFNDAGINSWDMSSASILNSMFQNCSFNQPLNNWDVSNVTSFLSMFQNTPFNQDIGNWNVSSASSMNQMFFQATNFNNGGSDSIKNWDVSNVSIFSGTNQGIFTNSAFNQPIGTWDVSSCSNFSSMFRATPFNQDIGAWNMSNATSIFAMFLGATNFNNGGSDSIKNWDVSNVVNFGGTFQNTPFNQPIGTWDVGSGTNFSAMFQATTSFNQDIGNWNVSSATNMSTTFNNATNFNNGGSDSIKNWDVSNVVSFGGINQGIFTNSAFNQPIGTWDVSSCSNFSSMFRASPFNQDIGSWDVSNGENFNQMFRDSQAFNQDIGNWNVSKGTNFANFMIGKSDANYSASNLDSIYNKWSLLNVVADIQIDFGSIKYTSAGAAGRAILTGSPNNWTITDGGQI